MKCRLIFSSSIVQFNNQLCTCWSCLAQVWCLLSPINSKLITESSFFGIYFSVSIFCQSVENFPAKLFCRRDIAFPSRKTIFFRYATNELRFIDSELPTLNYQNLFLNIALPFALSLIFSLVLVEHWECPPWNE